MNSVKSVCFNDDDDDDDDNNNSNNNKNNNNVAHSFLTQLGRKISDVSGDDRESSGYLF